MKSNDDSQEKKKKQAKPQKKKPTLFWPSIDETEKQLKKSNNPNK